VRTWVIKSEFRTGEWPDDLMCVELEGEYGSVFVYIQYDGKWDIDTASNDCPTARMFDEFTR
jgi:hypothetical protein